MTVHHKRTADSMYTSMTKVELRIFMRVNSGKRTCCHSIVPPRHAIASCSGDRNETLLPPGHSRGGRQRGTGYPARSTYGLGGAYDHCSHHRELLGTTGRQPSRASVDTKLAEASRAYRTLKRRWLDPNTLRKAQIR